MSKSFTRKLAVVVVILAPAIIQPASRAADFKKEVIYQIVTDRFFDGDAANDNPAQSSGLFDSTKNNFQAYWGGDLAGIEQKMSYIAGMGVTAIWISPPVDNENANEDGSSVGAPYHGYHARDFKRIEEHMGDASNSFAAFDSLVTAAHSKGIKVIVDFAPNHSNPNNKGEFGAFYDNGNLVGNYTNDTNGYFHHNPNLGDGDYNDRYKDQYYTLSDLADFNQENPTIDAYLKSAAQLFQQHHVDGFRVDAIKHTTWGWLYTLANSIYSNADTFTFGEWIADTTNDPLYHDLYKFANRSGFSALDFPLYNAIDDAFARDNSFSEIDTVLSQEALNFQQVNDLVTFIDNHDRQRFLSINKNQDRLHEALAFLLTCRGVPVIYYGTEQYLHNDTNKGVDPYNRPMMSSFDTTTTAYKLISKLSALRRSNPAIPYGTVGQRWINNDVYIYERKFAASVVLVAINKNDASGTPISGLFTALAAGNYTDYLGGMLGGPSITVTNGGGNNPVNNFTLPAHCVAVWVFNPGTAATPVLASIGPDVIQPGVQVTLAGSFAGSNTVKFGTTVATVVSSSKNQIVATVPTIGNGNYTVTVTDSSGHVSNGLPFTVLAAKLIPVTFTVTNAAPTVIGDYIFLSGDTVELGNWNTTWDGAVGPMLAPHYPDWFLNVGVPAGRTIQFKFIKIAANGTVTWEAGPNHSYTVPTSGTGFVNVSWQN
ncbi:MAG TPA: alpha-amylase family glycosyl hydrolase [Terriglobales bacterium]|nr:alpha-amylase family glycosyl hydrolase [Terriglobales bacterium]